MESSVPIRSWQRDLQHEEHAKATGQWPRPNSLDGLDLGPHCMIHRDRPVLEVSASGFGLCSECREEQRVFAMDDLAQQVRLEDAAKGAGCHPDELAHRREMSREHTHQFDH